jgi:hypothetical protein
VIGVGFYLGADLDQNADNTAVAVAEEAKEKGLRDRVENVLHHHHLECYPLKTPYPEQAERIARLMGSEELISETRVPWEPRGFLSLTT